ncbi:MAG: glycosyltransferase family 9 protein [Bacteroidota bacterium]
MSKIAIIKIGATGDVVRTSVLLHLYTHDEITWITARHNITVLPAQLTNLRHIVAIEDIVPSGILNEHFDLVISMDDDVTCATVASSMNTSLLFGAFMRDGKVNYTVPSREWFDMGLSSRWGKKRADELKWENQSSYQEILFRMLGHTFNGEEYMIPSDVIAKPRQRVIGIEARAGERWPTKKWDKFTQLAQRLTQDRYECIFFEDRKDIKDYMLDIGSTSLVVSGDTLGMHIALALKIPVVAIFTCTSAVEIYGYERMEKIVSPCLNKAFYKTDFIPEAVKSISVDEVYNAIKKLLQ